MVAPSEPGPPPRAFHHAFWRAREAARRSTRVALGRLVAAVGSTVTDRPADDVIAVTVNDPPPTTAAFRRTRRARRPRLVALADLLGRP